MVPVENEPGSRDPGRGRLAGRRILVVGAGARPSEDPTPPIGNGQAISALAAREGASVACVDINREAAEDAAAMAEQEAQEGSRTLGIAADVSNESGAIIAVEEAVREFGYLDGLVLNVGVVQDSDSRNLGGTTSDGWDELMAVNVRSHFLVLRATLPALEDGGSVVFVSSSASRRAGTRMPAYDSSKAALAGLCRHTAFEGSRRQIRANIVLPGLIDTPLGRSMGGDRDERAKSSVPMRRQGTAWEVAYAAVFLLSSESSYTTGEVVAVDGGYTTL